MTQKRGRPKKNPGTPFSNRLKELRESKNMSQATFSETIGAGLETYRKWEQGIFEPDINRLKQLADYFDCDIDYLVGRTDRENRDRETAAKYTGLSQQSLKYIHDSDQEYTEMLSEIILSKSFSEIMPNLLTAYIDRVRLNDMEHLREHRTNTTDVPEEDFYYMFSLLPESTIDHLKFQKKRIDTSIYYADTSFRNVLTEVLENAPINIRYNKNTYATYNSMKKDDVKMGKLLYKQLSRSDE